MTAIQPPADANVLVCDSRTHTLAHSLLFCVFAHLERTARNVASSRLSATLFTFPGAVTCGQIIFKLSVLGALALSRWLNFEGHSTNWEWLPGEVGREPAWLGLPHTPAH